MSWTWYADVGNCTIHSAAWAEDRWHAESRIPVDLLEDGAWETTLLSIGQEAGLDSGDCAQAVLSVSSPNARSAVEDFAARLLGTESVLAGEDFAVQLPTDYYDPAQVGVDRLLNALAAVARVGKPCVVVDFGSCVTCDAVTAQGVLTAGAIAPGLPVMRAGLARSVPHLARGQQDAMQLLGDGLLPAGRSTAEGLVLGIVAATAGSADRLIELMRRRLDAQAPVVATGGDAELFAPHCQVQMTIDRMLTLEGLRRAYESAEQS